MKLKHEMLHNQINEKHQNDVQVCLTKKPTYKTPKLDIASL